MGVKVDNPRDIDSSYDDLFSLEQRASAPNSAADYAAQDQRDAAVRENQQKDLGNAARSGEQTSGGWATNVTSRTEKRDIRRKLFGEIKTFIKHRGAIVGIVALLGGGAAVPFLGAAALPFSILGNMDARSMLHGLTKYNDDYIGFKLFGNNSSVSSSGDKLKGLTVDEIKQLEKGGVEFKGGNTNKLTGKTTFTHVKVQGGEWISASNFSSEMHNNSSFRKAMRFTRSGYFKSLKSIASANVRAKKYPINANPDIDGEDNKAREKKLFKNTAASSAADAVKLKPGDTNNKPEGVSNEKAASIASDSQGILDSVTDESATKRSAIEAATEFTSDMGRSADMSNIASQMEREAVDIEGATKGIGGKVWGFVNSLEVADMVCTTYQIAQTAAVVARTVALAHYVSYAMQLRAVIERTKAGDDTKGDTNFIMNLLSKRDPVTGLAFDSTSYAAFLFNGTVSDQPDSLSVFGGQSMIALNMGLGAIHTFVGGNPIDGRRILKQGCAIATNLGVQVVATLGGFFTGGLANLAVKGGTVGLKEAFKVGLSKLRESLVKNFGKEMIEKVSKDIAEKGAVKYFASRAWKGFANTWKSFDTLGKVGLVFAAVSTFGLAYVIDILSGTDIAALLTSGPMSMQALGTGWESFNGTVGLASGGSMASFAQYDKYRSQIQDEQASYIADMKQEASSRPFDITTPYSQLGSAIFSAQNLIGISASTNILSTIKSVAALPLRLPSLGAAAHAAASQPTAEEIAQKVGDEYAVNLGVARTITGVPVILFEKTITFDQFLSQFVDGPNAQVILGDTDEKTNEPKFTIKPDSELAKWRDACRNPLRTEPDETLASDETFYDMEKCTKNRNASFDDAISYVSQIGASEDNNKQDNSSPTVETAATGTCPTPGSTLVEGLSQGLDKSTGEVKSITLCAITGTSAQINPGWRDANYKGTSSKGISEIVVNSQAAPYLISANNKYKEKSGKGLSASVGYRSVYEQCSFFVGNKNSYSSSGVQGAAYDKYCKPNLGWLKPPVGNWKTDVIISNHMMGYSIDFLGESENWMRQCVQGDTDGKKDNRCFGFWDDVYQTRHWDKPHFTFDKSFGVGDK